jgi:hypothetical protein
MSSIHLAGDDYNSCYESASAQYQTAAHRIGKLFSFRHLINNAD